MTEQELINDDFKYLLDIVNGTVHKGRFTYLSSTTMQRYGRVHFQFESERTSPFSDINFTHRGSVERLCNLMDAGFLRFNELNETSLQYYSCIGFLAEEDPQYESEYLVFSSLENVEFVIKNFIGDIAIKNLTTRANHHHNVYMQIIDRIGELEKIKNKE
jgi:hypothetical protein